MLKHLAVVNGVLSNKFGRLESVGEEKASEVEEFGAVEEGLDGRGLEVGRLESLGGSEDGTEGAVSNSRQSTTRKHFCTQRRQVETRTGRVR